MPKFYMLDFMKITIIRINKSVKKFYNGVKFFYNLSKGKSFFAFFRKKLLLFCDKTSIFAV